MNGGKGLVVTLNVSILVAVAAVAAYHFAVVRPGPQQASASQQGSAKVEAAASAGEPSSAKTTESLTRIANDLDELYALLNDAASSGKDKGGKAAAEILASKTSEPLVRIADRVHGMTALFLREQKRGSEAARTNSLTSDLMTVRSQLELYKVQHNDEYPTLAKFVTQLTQPTDIKGEVVQQERNAFGPYLRVVPTNSFSGGNTVGNGAVGTSDWFYDEKTGNFLANDSKEHAAN